MNRLIPLVVALAAQSCGIVVPKTPSPYPEAAAGRIASDLVQVAARTVEMAPGSASTCLTRQPTHAGFGEVLESTLRQRGYALAATSSRSGTCLSFRLFTRPGLTQQRSYATACLTDGAKMICREYALPGGQATTAVSLVGVTVAANVPEPARQSGTTDACHDALLIERAAITVPAQPDGDQGFNDEVLLRDFANRFQQASHCIVLTAPDSEALLARAESIEASLRQYGVPAADITRVIKSDTDPSAVVLELRRGKP